MMVIYILALLPLSKFIRAVDQVVLQPWYADDASMRGTYRLNTKLLRTFMEKFTSRSRRRAGIFLRRRAKRRS